MIDPIDRQDALKAIQDLYPTMPRINFGDNISNWQQKYRQYIECENAIRILPSAERRGHWIYTPTSILGYVCSECGKAMCRFNYCPHCGAKME